jgi:hypothetical protein
MQYVKIGGLVIAGLLAWWFFSWATSQIRRGYEADALQAEIDRKAELDAADAKAYQEGLNDGAASAKTVERIKVVYKKVPVHAQSSDSCSIDPRAIELRNAARREGYREAVPDPGASGSDTDGDGATPAEAHP